MTTARRQGGTGGKSPGPLTLAVQAAPGEGPSYEQLTWEHHCAGERGPDREKGRIELEDLVAGA